MPLQTVITSYSIHYTKLYDVDLGNLNVALAVYSPGHMAEVKWRAALYLDHNASEKQKDALTRVITSYSIHYTKLYEE